MSARQIATQFEERRYEIAEGTPKHPTARQIDGYVYLGNPRLGYHYETNGYVIDHIPTGRAIQKLLSGKQARVRIIAMAHLDWNFNKRTMKRACAALAPEVNRILLGNQKKTAGAQ